jgi:hypothetical protein
VTESPPRARRTTAVKALAMFLDPSDSETGVDTDHYSEEDSNDENCK